MTTCLLCGKKDFDKPSGCLNSRTYTHAVGDWVCKLGSDGVLQDGDKISRSAIKKTVQIIMRDLIKNKMILSSCITKVTPLRVDMSIVCEHIKFVVLMTDINGQKNCSVTKYTNDVKVKSITIPTTYDTTYFISSVREIIDLIINPQEK